MKRILCLALWGPLAPAAIAQLPQVDSTGSRKVPPAQSEIVGSPVYRGSKGTVYTLQPDNMPCLVPDKAAVVPMPNGRWKHNDGRINAWPRKPLVPSPHQYKKKD